MFSALTGPANFPCYLYRKRHVPRFMVRGLRIVSVVRVRAVAPMIYQVESAIQLSDLLFPTSSFLCIMALLLASVASMASVAWIC